MSIQPDWWIREQAVYVGMITPFAEGEKRPGIISYGLSSYGYDVRLDDKFQIFRKPPLNYDYGSIIDPKNFDSYCTDKEQTNVLTMPPHSFALASTIERLKIPRDILVVCVGKSTYARCGLIINVTPLEPEWEGQITIEISNTTSLPALVYANEGIAQLLFFKTGGLSCTESYADKLGKYQGQSGITLPRL